MSTALLFVLGGNATEEIIGALRKHGCEVITARGPLKTKGILESRNIALIVWEEGPDNCNITKEMAQIWARHPEIPVFHLFTTNGVTQNTTNQICRSVPLEGSAEKIIKYLDQNSSRSNVIDFPSGDMKSELSIKNIIKVRMNKRPYEKQIVVEGDEMEYGQGSYSTSIKSVERNLLTQETNDRSLGASIKFILRNLFRKNG